MDCRCLVIQMNYCEQYRRLILRAIGRELDGYTEGHHVIPKCMGGKDGPVVNLTPEEHFLAHQLLVKMYPMNYHLIRAVNLMTIDKDGRRTNNKLYGWHRKRLRESLSAPKSEQHKAAIRAALNRSSCKEAARKRMLGNTNASGSTRTKSGVESYRNKMKAYWADPEWKTNILSKRIGQKHPKQSRAMIGNQYRLGIPQTTDTKERISKSMTGNQHLKGHRYPRIECTKCHKLISQNRLDVHMKAIH